jgi:hypothetical protein
MTHTPRRLVSGFEDRSRAILGFMARTAPRFSSVWIALGLLVVCGTAAGISSGNPSVAVVLLLVLMFGVGIGAMQIRLASLARSLRRVRTDTERQGPRHS